MNFPHEVDLTDQYDFKYNGIDSESTIKCLGKATLQENGMYKVLAIVNDALCIIEVKLTFTS